LPLARVFPFILFGLSTRISSAPTMDSLFVPTSTPPKCGLILQADSLDIIREFEEFDPAAIVDAAS
jgi:hypothetical protein